MTTVLEVLVPSKKIAPKLRVRCDGCGRVYVTNQWPGVLRGQKACTACVRRMFDDPKSAQEWSRRGVEAKKNRKGKEPMAKNGVPRTRRSRVWVPDDVRKAVVAIYETHEPGRGRLRHAGKVLGIAECTIAEIMAPGGAVQQQTLDRVRARLAELAKETKVAMSDPEQKLRYPDGSRIQGAPPWIVWRKCSVPECGNRLASTRNERVPLCPYHKPGDDLYGRKEAP